MKTLLKIRSGGDVKRFHTVTMLREHLVATHAWGVAVILLYVEEEPSLDLIKAAIYHDVAEHVTGDVAAPTKWQYPDLAQRLHAIEEEVERELGIRYELNGYELGALKFADMADLTLACLQEYELGNRTVAPILRRALAYLQERIYSTRAEALWHYLRAAALELGAITDESE